MTLNAILLSFFFLIKPIVDMFYQYRFLDVFLVGCTIILLIIKSNNIRFLKIDLIILALLSLQTFALFRNMESSSVLTYYKIIFQYIAYFTGRLYWKYWEKSLVPLKYGYVIVVGGSLATFLLRTGFIYWGHAYTFRGLFYFKTDLAAAMVQAIIIFMFSMRSRICCILFSLVSVIMLFLSNARAYYFVLIIILFFIFVYKFKGKIALDWKSILKMAILIIACLFVLKWMGNLTLLKRMGFISIEFSSISDLFSGANTQGRNSIWAGILQYFNGQSFVSRLFGIDLISDSLHGTLGASTTGAHSLYIKILYSTGYAGILVFIFFLYRAMRILNRVGNRKLFYITLCFCTIYLLGGISYVTMESTQISFLSFYFMGTCVSDVYTNILQKENNDELSSG